MTGWVDRDELHGGWNSSQEIIVLCVRWYVTCRLSYRDLAGRGVYVVHPAIFRWVPRHIPEYVRRWDCHRQGVRCSWRAGETSILVEGRRHYLYRAVDKRGRSVDSYGSEHRDIVAAMAFFRKAVATHRRKPPRNVTVVGNRAAHRPLRLLRRRNFTWRRASVRSCQSLDYVVEDDCRAIKRRVSAMLGFKSFASASTTLMGIELAHPIRKYQFSVRYGRSGHYGSKARAWSLALT